MSTYSISNVSIDNHLRLGTVQATSSTISSFLFRDSVTGVVGSATVTAISGATGPQGAQGPQGVQGVQGPQGNQGPVGSNGSNGSQGPTGPASSNGTQGPQGPTGAGSSVTLPNGQTASYTFVLADKDKIVRMDSTDPTSVTVPLNSSVNFPIGTSLCVRNTNTGTVTITPFSGVTLNGIGTYELDQYESAVLHKVDTNTWDVYLGTGGGSANQLDEPLITAVAVAYNEIDLTAVTAPTGATTLVIQRSTVSNFSSNLVNIYSGAPTSSYADTASLAASTHYYYRGRFTGSGYSPSEWSLADDTTYSAPVTLINDDFTGATGHGWGVVVDPSGGVEGLSGARGWLLHNYVGVTYITKNLPSYTPGDLLYFTVVYESELPGELLYTYIDGQGEHTSVATSDHTVYTDTFTIDTTGFTGTTGEVQIGSYQYNNHYLFVHSVKIER